MYWSGQGLCVGASSNGLLDDTAPMEEFTAAEAEASLLSNKPSDVDYSDLASFLTESFNTSQVGVGSLRLVVIADAHDALPVASFIYGRCVCVCVFVSCI